MNPLGHPTSQDPWDLYGGGVSFRLVVLAVVSLAVGGVVAIAASGFALTDQLIGTAVVGLLLLAPLPMLAGDATDALLLAAARRGRLSNESYRRTAAWAVPGALVLVGIATYPIVLAVGGVELLGVFVIVGAFLIFGALPVGAWLVRKLRRPRSEP